MKAMFVTRYGPPEVLQPREVATPTPRPRQVRIRIHAATVTPSDCLLRSGKFPWLFWIPVRLLFGVFKPRHMIPGYEVSGVIDAIGTEVTRFAVGDEVYGATMWAASCNAEYVCVKETAPLIAKPAGLSHREAVACIDGACTALHFLQRAGVREGMRVAINGASGSVGSAGVQIARAMGAEVTAICSGKNAEFVRGLGAAEVVDYTTTELASQGTRFDVVFDAVGKLTWRQALAALVPGGVLASTMELGPVSALRRLWLRVHSNKRVIGGMTVTAPERLAVVADWVATGAFRPVVDSTYDLLDAAAAHRYVERGRKRGNVVLVTAHARAAPPAVA